MFYTQAHVFVLFIGRDELRASNFKQFSHFGFLADVYLDAEFQAYMSVSKDDLLLLNFGNIFFFISTVYAKLTHYRIL